MFIISIRQDAALRNKKLCGSLDDVWYLCYNKNQETKKMGDRYGDWRTEFETENK